MSGFLKIRLLFLTFVGIAAVVFPQISHAQSSDSLSCQNNIFRSWWKVDQYHLTVDFRDTIGGQIQGVNELQASVMKPSPGILQVDLDSPMVLEKVYFKKRRLKVTPHGNHYLIHLEIDQKPIAFRLKDTFSLKLVFKGRPKEAQKPPWDGGFVRTRDSTGSLWWAVACQGEGASIWFPCKNFQGDEPNRVLETYIVPKPYQAVGNGRLVSKKETTPQMVSYTWQVVNSINNYDITFYIGKYFHWQDIYQGKDGPLTLDFYVLPHDSAKARRQFQEVKTMLNCFEDKIGPYPFYQDGYKLVEAPYLGMEHQSAVAYGNGFQMGYLGMDRSGSGVGLLFDFIIVHESAHEWFGNSITAYDKADEWIHEGFASYAETIYAECIAGKDKAFKYQEGKKGTIKNEIPVEGNFNSCDEGSPDAYDKGGFLLHTIRLLMKDDNKFFAMLKAISKQYGHQIVTGKQIEAFIQDYSGLDLSKIFDQYLRTAGLPVLVFSSQPNGTLEYEWRHCVPDFDMPVSWEQGGRTFWLYPTTSPQYFDAGDLTSANQINPGFLIDVQFENREK